MTDRLQHPPRPRAADHAPDPVADRLRVGYQVIGLDWRYVFVNNAAAAHGRRTPAELEGRTMMEMYPGIEQTPMFDVLRRCMTERIALVMENLFEFPDGQQRWFEVRAEPSPDGINVFSFDIHERKVAELEAAAARAAFARLPLPVRLLKSVFGGHG